MPWQLRSRPFRGVAAFTLAFLAVALAGSYSYPKRARAAVRVSTVRNSAGELISSQGLAVEALNSANLQSRISQAISGELGVRSVPFQLSALAEPRTGVLQIRVTAASMKTATRVADIAAEAVVEAANRGELGVDWAEIERAHFSEQDLLAEITRLTEQAAAEVKDPQGERRLRAALARADSRLTAIRQRLLDFQAELGRHEGGNATILDQARPDLAGKRWLLLAVSVVAGLLAAGAMLTRRPAPNRE